MDWLHEITSALGPGHLALELLSCGSAGSFDEHHIDISRFPVRLVEVVPHEAMRSPTVGSGPGLFKRPAGKIELVLQATPAPQQARTRGRRVTLIRWHRSPAPSPRTARARIERKI